MEGFHFSSLEKEWDKKMMPAYSTTATRDRKQQLVKESAFVY